MPVTRTGEFLLVPTILTLPFLPSELRCIINYSREAFFFVLYSFVVSYPSASQFTVHTQTQRQSFDLEATVWPFLCSAFLGLFKQQQIILQRKKEAFVIFFSVFLSSIPFPRARSMLSIFISDSIFLLIPFPNQIAPKFFSTS